MFTIQGKRFVFCFKNWAVSGIFSQIGKFAQGSKSTAHIQGQE